MKYSSIVKLPVLVALGWLATAPLQTQAANFYYAGIQGGGSTWNAAIWTNVANPTPVVPTSGNTYEVVAVNPLTAPQSPQGLVRSPTSAGSAGSVQFFNGDSIQFDGTNGLVGGDIRLKGPAGGFSLAYYGFGGVNGVYLNGGFLANGDDDIGVMTGPIHVLQRSGIYGGQDPVTCNSEQQAGGFRGFIFNGTLDGTGDLIFGNAVLGSKTAAYGSGNVQYATNANFVFLGDGSGYSGNVIVYDGWLQVSSPNGFGAGNITIDGGAPDYNQYNGFVTPGSVTTVDTGTNLNNGTVVAPAKFDSTIPFSTTGTLTIANTNSFLYLDNHITVGAAIIDGVQLMTNVITGNSNYTAAAINAITGLTNIVDGTGTNILSVGVVYVQPTITVQPLPQIVITNQTARFFVTAFGFAQEKLTYAWLSNGIPLVASAHIPAVTNSTLFIDNVAAADAANYSVLITGVNSGLSTSSTAVSLTIASPNSYGVAVGKTPGVAAYYAFSENSNPALGGQEAYDYVGGFDGTYGLNVLNGFNSIAGPNSSEGFTNMPLGNTAIQVNNGVVSNYVSLPALNLNSSAVTISAWVYPTAVESGSRAIVFYRGNGTVVGLGYNSTLVNGDYQLGYSWDNTNTTLFQSGLFVPQNQWSMVTLSISSTNAILYLINTNGVLSAENDYPNIPEAFNTVGAIGDDTGDGGNGSRNFKGSIDEVSIFKGTLNENQLLSLYAAASGTSNFPPHISVQPVPAQVFAGATVTFTAKATGSPTYQWYKGSTALVNGLTVSGSTVFGATTGAGQVSTVTISNVAAGDVANYSVVATNITGSVTSTPVALSIVAPADAYETAIAAAHANYFYDFNDTGFPSPGPEIAYDYEGGNNGIYGTATYNGADGTDGPRPSPDGYPGFSSGNLAVEFAATTANSTVVTPGWNLNGNALTITAWINPLDPNGDGTYSAAYGLVMCRNINAGAYGGLNFAGPDGGTYDLGYDWGDLTTNYVSGIHPPVNVWSFVAVSITPTNATLYLINSSGMQTAVHTFNHAPLAFSSIVSIGGDAADGQSGNLTFPGTMDNVGIFKSSLNQSQLMALYAAASGNSNFAPVIESSPTNQTVVQSQTATFSVAASGNPGPFYIWQTSSSFGGPYTTISDGAGSFGSTISGSRSPTLTIQNVALSGATFPYTAYYQVIVSNANGNSTTAAATLSASAAPTATNMTLNFGGSPTNEVQGQDWNSTNVWSPGGLPASVSAAVGPLNTYEVPAGALLRAPGGGGTFPGRQLTIDGNGVYTNPFTNSPVSVGELRLKGTPTSYQSLIMNGGQLDASSGQTIMSVVNGSVSILANTPIYDDSGNDQGLQIAGTLSGSAGIEYHDVGWSIANGMTLNISGGANTYSGPWNIVQGTLLGSATGSLGTNNITVGATAALETTYDLNAPAATLTLNGQMLLHQNDTFLAMTVNGAIVAAGTYSAGTLFTNYGAAYFPSSWAVQNGSSVSTASGQIHVLTGVSAPPTVAAALANGSLVITWNTGSLYGATNVLGPWVKVVGATSPYTNTPSALVPDNFYRSGP